MPVHGEPIDSGFLRVGAMLAVPGCLSCPFRQLEEDFYAHEADPLCTATNHLHAYGITFYVREEDLTHPDACHRACPLLRYRVCSRPLRARSE